MPEDMPEMSLIAKPKACHHYRPNVGKSTLVTACWAKIVWWSLICQAQRVTVFIFLLSEKGVAMSSSIQRACVAVVALMRKWKIFCRQDATSQKDANVVVLVIDAKEGIVDPRFAYAWICTRRRACHCRGNQ